MRSEGNAVQLRTGNATCKCGGHQLRLKDQIWESEPTTAEETKEHKQQEKLRTFWKLRQEGEKMTSTITFLHCIMHLTYFLLRFEWEMSPFGQGEYPEMGSMGVGIKGYKPVLPAQLYFLIHGEGTRFALSSQSHRRMNSSCPTDHDGDKR